VGEGEIPRLESAADGFDHFSSGSSPGLVGRSRPGTNSAGADGRSLRGKRASRHRRPGLRRGRAVWPYVRAPRLHPFAFLRVDDRAVLQPLREAARDDAVDRFLDGLCGGGVSRILRLPHHRWDGSRVLQPFFEPAVLSSLARDTGFSDRREPVFLRERSSSPSVGARMDLAAVLSCGDVGSRDTKAGEIGLIEFENRIFAAPRIRFVEPAIFQLARAS